MISKNVRVETDGTRFSRRFGPAAQGHLKAPPKSDTKKCQNYAKPQAETMHFRMIDLNLFRVFDAVMLHRSVRKSEPNAFGNSFGGQPRLEQATAVDWR